MIQYQENLDEEPGGRDTRPIREYSSPTIEKIDGRHFLFASDVFDLSRGGKKLSEEELINIPVRALYNGPEIEYKTDEKEAFEILLKILSNGNKMQDPEFYSFALGKRERIF